MAGLFMKIIQGEIPSYKLHEDEHVYAFLARDQIQEGHLLVVPKIEVDHFVDVPEPYYSAVFRAARPLARALQRVTECRRVGAMIMGMEVPHFHLHLVPMQVEADMSFQHARLLKPSQMEEIQRKLVAALADELARDRS